MVKLFGKPIRVNKSSQNKQSQDIGTCAVCVCSCTLMNVRRLLVSVDPGANLFIGGLHQDVDEKLLYDTFSAFGGIIFTPKVRARCSVMPISRPSCDSRSLSVNACLSDHA